jgi:hypothetical protein
VVTHLPGGRYRGLAAARIVSRARGTAASEPQLRRRAPPHSTSRTSRYGWAIRPGQSRLPRVSSRVSGIRHARFPERARALAGGRQPSRLSCQRHRAPRQLSGKPLRPLERIAGRLGRCGARESTGADGPRQAFKPAARTVAHVSHSPANRHLSRLAEPVVDIDLTAGQH